MNPLVYLISENCANDNATKNIFLAWLVMHKGLNFTWVFTYKLIYYGSLWAVMYTQNVVFNRSN